MLENAEQVNKEVEDVVNSVLGGAQEDASHSRGEDEDITGRLGTGDNAPETEDKKTVDDSAKKEEPDVNKMQAEIENLSKRLHDTQSAMHRATEERSKLEKELNDLKNKQADEDDWFSEEDKEKSEQLEGDLKKSEEELSRLDAEKTSIEVKAAEAIWDAAAAKVIADHPDFEEVVYGKLAPLIDENNDTPEAKRVRELYAKTDRSPASAYKFAKELEDRLLIDSDPEAYKQKIRSEIEREYRGEESQNIEGKDGLDLINSADGVDYNTAPSGDVLDFLPK